MVTLDTCSGWMAFVLKLEQQNSYEVNTDLYYSTPWPPVVIQVLY